MGNFWQLARQKLGTEVLPRQKPYMEAFSGESFFWVNLDSKLISVEFRGIFSVVGLPLDANGLTRPESEPF